MSWIPFNCIDWCFLYKEGEGDERYSRLVSLMFIERFTLSLVFCYWFYSLGAQIPWSVLFLVPFFLYSEPANSFASLPFSSRIFFMIKSLSIQCRNWKTLSNLSSKICSALSKSIAQWGRWLMLPSHILIRKVSSRIQSPSLDSKSISLNFSSKNS